MSLTDSPASGPVATIAGLPIDVHDHLCLLYRGEAQRDELMVDFLAEGVRARHRCYCMIAASEHARIATAVAAQDRSREVAGSLEFVGPSGSYLDAGGFASDRMLSFWDEWGAAAYAGQGHTFARIGADMSWAKQFVGPDFIADLVRYESRFNLWARRYPQVTACMYDLDKFGGEVVVPIVKVHPKVWLAGLVLTNPYYLDSDYLLSTEVDDLLREGATVT